MRGSMMKELDDLVERDKPMIDKNVRVISNYEANFFSFFKDFTIVGNNFESDYHNNKSSSDHLCNGS